MRLWPWWISLVLLIGCGKTLTSPRVTSTAPEPIDGSGAMAYGFVVRHTGYGPGIDGVYGEMASKAGQPFFQPNDSAFSAPLYQCNSVSQYYSAGYGGIGAHLYAASGGSLTPPKPVEKYKVTWTLACASSACYGDGSGYVGGENLNIRFGDSVLDFPEPVNASVKWKGGTLLIGTKGINVPGHRQITSLTLQAPGGRKSEMSYIETWLGSGY